MRRRPREHPSRQRAPQPGKHRPRSGWPRPRRQRLPHRRALLHRLEKAGQERSDRNDGPGPLPRVTSDHDRGPIDRQGFDDGQHLLHGHRPCGQQADPGSTRAQLGDCRALGDEIGDGPGPGEVQIATKVYDQGGRGRLTETERRQQREHWIGRRHTENAKSSRGSPHPHHVPERIEPGRALQGV